MIVEPNAAPQASPYADVYARLVRSNFDTLAPHVDRLAEIEVALRKLENLNAAAAARTASRLRAKLRRAEPSVTMIGQVKAGKTTLVNAMAGWPGLLPADVNPWTSVVTSLHLHPLQIAETQARFQFFSSDEWDRLVLRGGRVGELAGRAGAAVEVEKVRRQIAETREKSRRRLGRKFELLLGQEHAYSHVNSDLIERYVCLGDDLEDDTVVSKIQGRFADITKSADLYLHRPELPMALCIRDTPGVNDTFMVREQITIRALRDSRICVVVLSASQAMSSVDMALIRLITNVKSREVIVFVNRIDELPDPARQIPEIRDSIQHTLREHRGPAEAQIVFGSAHWANQALTEFRDDNSEASLAALLAYAENTEGEWADRSQKELAWHFSGLPHLFDAIAERILEGAGRELLDEAARDVRNLAGSLKATNRIVALRDRDGAGEKIDPEELSGALDRIRSNGESLMNQEFKKLLEQFDDRLDRAHGSFLLRATTALIDHLEKHGDTSAWKYDPTGLRLLFRSTYQTYVKRANDTVKKLLEAASRDLVQIYRQYGLVDDTDFEIEPPAVPRVPPPVLLGQTIALDLQTNWWSRWWRKQRGYRAFAEDFYNLIRAETEPIAGGLKTDHATAVRINAMQALATFIDEQSSTLMDLTRQGDSTAEELVNPKIGESSNRRQEVLDEVIQTLGQVAA